MNAHPQVGALLQGPPAGDAVCYVIASKQSDAAGGSAGTLVLKMLGYRYAGVVGERDVGTQLLPGFSE